MRTTLADSKHQRRGRYIQPPPVRTQSTARGDSDHMRTRRSGKVRRVSLVIVEMVKKYVLWEATMVVPLVMMTGVTLLEMDEQAHGRPTG